MRTVPAIPSSPSDSPVRARRRATGDRRADGARDADDGSDRDGAEAEVASLMAQIAAGHRAAVWRLHTLAGPPVRSRLRSELRRLGVRYDAEDLEALLADAVLAIADVAPAWRPGGAPPWAWAHHRVVGVVHRWVGTFADSLDGMAGGDADGALGWFEGRQALAAVPAPGGNGAVDPDEVVTGARTTLRRLAATHPAAAELDAALSALVSPTAAAVWLTVTEEAACGNRHPAVTAGARFGMRPDTVRKTVQRVRRRLADAVADGRFPTLAGLPGLADVTTVAA